MDKEDAESFTALCRIAVQLDGIYSPVVIDSKFEDYEALIGITFDKLLSLSTLGLIEMELGELSAGYAITTDNFSQSVTYFDMEYRLPEEEKQIKVGNVLFTKSGQALCRSISVDKLEGFWEKYCLPFWESGS